MMSMLRRQEDGAGRYCGDVQCPSSSDSCQIWWPDHNSSFSPPVPIGGGWSFDITVDTTATMGLSLVVRQVSAVPHEMPKSKK